MTRLFLKNGRGEWGLLACGDHRKPIIIRLLKRAGVAVSAFLSWQPS